MLIKWFYAQLRDIFKWEAEDGYTCKDKEYMPVYGIGPAVS